MAAGDARWEAASLLRSRKDEEDEREEDERTGQTEGNELEKNHEGVSRRSILPLDAGSSPPAGPGSAAH